MKKIISVLALVLTFFIPGVLAEAEYTTIDNGDNTVTVLETEAPVASDLKSDQNIGNYPGPLGDIELDSSDIATIQADSNVGMVGAGYHSGVIMDDNSLWVWGSNDKGEVGDGTTENKNKPVKVLDNVVSFDIGYEGSAAITNDGSLYTWGRNDYGQVGNGSTGLQLTPVKILDNVKKVTIGAFNTAAIKNDGSLWVWGNNYYGQVGLGYTGNKVEVGSDGTAVMTPYILNPTKIIDKDVVDVSLGQGFSSCVKADGTLYTWGQNSIYQLGDGKTTDVYTPTKVQNNIKAVSVGMNFGTALTKDNKVISWGSGEDGQLGNGSTKDQSTPKEISGLKDISIINSGLSGTGAVSSNGDLYIWGYGENGNLGTGKTSNQLTPTKVTTNVKDIAIGLYHSIIVKKDNSLWASGSNSRGQLGNGTDQSSLSFVKVLNDLTPDKSYTPETYTGTFVFNHFYSQVQHELEMINAERAKVGAKPLTLDKSLTDTAMQRAGELNVFYSHTRPNGSQCFSANSKMNGENIAAGYSDVEDVMDGWMHSEGHKANILNTQFNSVGIGITSSPDSHILYFAQCFGVSNGSGTPDKQDKTVTQKINGFKSEYLKEVNLSDTNDKLKEDESKTVKLIAKVDNDFTTMNLPLSTTSVSSSDPAVISVSGTTGTGTDITIKALKTGSSKVSLASDSLKKDITYTVTAKNPPNITYRTHVENIGWQSDVSNGATSGTSGQSLRLEGIYINLPDSSDLGLEYRTHVENIGWQSYVSTNQMAGTTGQALRLEAIQIRLTGADKDKYDVYYRVHAQDVGWMNWAKNDQMAGTAGFARRLEAIQIRIMPKDQVPNIPADTPNMTDQSFMQK